MKIKEFPHRIGIFDILYKCDNKSIDGHNLYHAKCTICGKEFNRCYKSFKRATNCKHLLIDGSYRNSNTTWKSQRLRNTYKNMLYRCYNINSEAYPIYGGKGITVCEEWLNNGKTFEQWAYNNGYNDTLTIHRKDESKNYCPENCEWATRSYNSKYRSDTNIITIDGVTDSAKGWDRRLGINPGTLSKVIKKYNIDKAIQLIEEMLKNPPDTKNKKSNQSWIAVYNLL